MKDIKKINGIIVLGGSEDNLIAQARKQFSLNEGGERLIAFASLAARFPNARLVYSGGSGALSNDYKDSETARLIFLKLGMDISRIEFDSRSRNTFESAANTYPNG